MKAIVRLDDDLLRRAKQLALQHDQTLASVIEDALRQLLARHEKANVSPSTKLPTDSGRGLQPGISLDSMSALRDLMSGGR